VRRLSIIGIGAGDPDYVTVQAIKAMNSTDVFFVVDKGQHAEDLLRLRHEICRRYIEHDRYRIVELDDPVRDLTGPDYGEAVGSWREQRVASWAQALHTELGIDQAGAFLVWGDPALYDGTLRVLENVRDRGLCEFELDVIPGISAVQALAARHQIPLNQVGMSVLVTTGRELVEGWPNGVEDVVVMLDPRCSFDEVEDHNTTIYWGAYLGTPDEILISGPIAECGEEIERVRAAARARKGWMFDTYLLRRTRRR